MVIFLIGFLFFLEVLAQNDIIIPSGQSLYVVDGDSVNIKMRLKGIDTPEIKQTCEVIKGEAIDCGKLAQRFLKKLLKDTPGILRINIIDFDQYSRALVSIKKGRINIAKQMVLKGYAYSYHDYPNAQRQAKRHKLGFWQFYKPPINPKLWRKSHKRR